MSFIKKNEKDYNDGIISLNELDDIRSHYSKLTDKDKLTLDNQSKSIDVDKVVINEDVSSLKESIQNKSKIKIVSVLSMIGTSFWILTFLFLLFEPTFLNISKYIFIFFVILLMLKFWGALNIYKLKKGGFNIYRVCNIIFTLFMLFSILSGHQENLLFAWSMVILFSVFLIIFNNFKKYLINT